MFGEDMNKLLLRSLAITGSVIIWGSAFSQTLTGINWYTTNSSKQYTGGYGNTDGGDTYSRNLYVSLNQDVGAGPLLNSANLTTAPTRVSVDLSSPGLYKFQMYCNDESSIENPFWGLNLFFDGDDLKPGVSAWNVVNVAGFQSVNPAGTPTLDPLTMGLVQSSNGSGVRYVSPAGDKDITLVDYKTWNTTHYNVDRVDNWSSMNGLGNGTKDQVIEFSLQVTSVPEPATILILGGSALAAAVRRRVRKSTV